MSTEGERLFELATEIGKRLGEAFQGMIPPEAQRHLLNAQRELFTAAFLIYEHRVSAQPEAYPEADTGAPDPEPHRRPRRVDHIEVE